MRNKNDSHKKTSTTEVVLRRYFWKTFIAAGIVIYLWYNLSNGTTWRQGMFDNCDQFKSAFLYVSYDDIVKEFGEPYDTFVHYNGMGCSQGECYEATWSGIGVKNENRSLFLSQ